MLSLLLTCLMGCAAPNQVIRSEYISPDFTIPQEPILTPVSWKIYGDLYCLTEDDSKQMLMNWTRLQAYKDELKTILEGLK